MRTNIFIIIIVTLVGTYFWLSLADFDVHPTPVACTTEARMCPDGTAVGRTGPSCEFSPCPTENSSSETSGRPDSNTVACTMDAMACPDGSYVGRVPPSCEFSPCPAVQANIKNRILVSTPTLNQTIASPVTIEGIARGSWFFEASFPISIVNWDGLIIGEGIAHAEDDWMTEDFVPFTATVSYTLPNDTLYDRGAIILRKDNPSGLPEHDDALEIPVTFSELNIQVQ